MSIVSPPSSNGWNIPISSPLCAGCYFLSFLQLKTSSSNLYRKSISREELISPSPPYKDVYDDKSQKKVFCSIKGSRSILLEDFKAIPIYTKVNFDLIRKKGLLKVHTREIFQNLFFL
jgi:hypothetical protein